jgi:hypothetical protein
MSKGTDSDPAASLGSQRDAMLSLAKLARREHLACEDRWYSCPLAEGGCANDVWGKDECSCGARRINAEVDAIVAAFPESAALTDAERKALADGIYLCEAEAGTAHGNANAHAWAEAAGLLRGLFDRLK